MTFRIISAALWGLSAVLLFLIVGANFFPGISAYSGALRPVVDLVVGVLDRGDSIAKITVVSIIAIFAWAILEVAIRSAIVWRERAAVSWFASLATQRMSDTLGLVRLVHTNFIRSDRQKPGGLWGRWADRSVLRAEVINNSDVLNLSDALPGSAAVDASSLAANYTPLQVYAWILPVLGFIGTASGMASSIEGFSAAIAGTSDTQNIIAVLSAKVIPGLTGAFQTTMLALAASVVVYVCTTAVKNWDQETLDELDRLSLQFIPVAIPSGGVGGTPPDIGEIPRLLREIVARVRRVDEAAERLESASTLLETASEKVQKASDEFGKLFTFPYVIKIDRGGPR